MLCNVVGFPSVHPVVASVPLPPNRALPKLFPTVSRPSTLSSLPCRSLPTELSQSYFPPFFPSVHPVVASVSLPPNGALPKLFPTVSRPSTMSTLPCRSLPTELSPSYLPRFPVRPPCRRFRVAPSQRSSPQAISHGFPSVHDVNASVSLPPNGALPKLFPTVSRPSTLSSLPCCSLPTELSPSYLPRFPDRPPCQRFRLVPSQLSSPQAISHGFPSVHPVVAELSPLRGKVK